MNLVERFVFLNGEYTFWTMLKLDVSNLVKPPMSHNTAKLL